MLSSPSCSEPTQDAECKSRDASAPSASSGHKVRISSNQQLAAHHTPRASPDQRLAAHQRDQEDTCISSDDADACVRTPSNIGLLRMFDLMKEIGDPASPRGAWSNLEETVMARNILRTSSTEELRNLPGTGSVVSSDCVGRRSSLPSQ